MRAVLSLLVFALGTAPAVAVFVDLLAGSYDLRIAAAGGCFAKGTGRWNSHVR